MYIMAHGVHHGTILSLLFETYKCISINVESIDVVRLEIIPEEKYLFVPAPNLPLSTSKRNIWLMRYQEGLAR